MTDKSENVIAFGKEILRKEADAIRDTADRLGIEFDSVVRKVLHCTGKVVLSGVGKSGLVAKKISATLSSTGTPSIYIHPTDASHGDLGVLADSDLFIGVSNSGETNELLALLPSLKRMGIEFVLLTGNGESTLAKVADVFMEIFVTEEACPLGLAPTSSTTASLALGDALALSVSNLRQFSREDFAKTHPAGSLGRALLVRVGDVMRSKGQIPRVTTGDSLMSAILEITEKRLGVTTVVDAEMQVVGVFTDGDLRRALNRGMDLYSTKIVEVMSQNPAWISKEKLISEALIIFDKRSVTSLIVLDEQRKLEGIVHLNDLIQKKIL